MVNMSLKNRNKVDQNSINDNAQMKVTSITASNYNSLVIFLHASDFEDKKISEEISSLRHVMKIT